MPLGADGQAAYAPASAVVAVIGRYRDVGFAGQPITKVTLDIQPAYAMRQDVYLDLPMSQVRDHFDDVVSAGYSVSLFTDWQKGRVNEVWIKRRTDTQSAPAAESEFYGAARAWQNRLPGVPLPISAFQVPAPLLVPGCTVQFDLWVYAP